MCLSKHAEPSVNFGIINSITKLHLVGISTEECVCYDFVVLRCSVIEDSDLLRCDTSSLDKWFRTLTLR